MTHSRTPRRAARALLLLGASLLGPLASAQVDLPRPSDAGSRPSDAKKDAPAPELPERNHSTGRSLVPHLLCSVCGERNYTSARDRPTEGGFFMAFCSSCKRDCIHRASSSSGGSGILDLPSRASAPRTAAPQKESQKPAAAAPSQAPDPQRRSSADELFRQVQALGDLGSPLIAKVVESLLAMGEEGLQASRVALHDESPAGVLTAARVLLRGGTTEDALRVVERMRAKLPAQLGPRLLEEILQSDPVHGSPALLVEMLDHPQPRVRLRARTELQRQLGPGLLPLLEKAMSSKRPETRLEVVQLAAAIDHPGVVDFLLEHLDDPSARVASEAVAAVAGRDDPDLSRELEARAFSSAWTLREHAYVLLAIAEREDLLLQLILDERHAEPLLRALEMKDAFVYGACATALAGIGFRSPDPERSGWLDREVTGRLVAIVSGREYHADLPALQPRALRRLKLLSGVDFGNDGPAWARWWVERRETFFARRVSVPIPPERAPRLELHYRAGGEQPQQFSLFGPEADEKSVVARAAGEAFRLTVEECRELAALLEREGALGIERLPGLRGSDAVRARNLEFLVDGRGKSFGFSPEQSEPWFERLCAAAGDLRERNRWQRFPDFAQYASEREFWEAEAPWWSEQHSERERALRLKGLALGAARSLSPSRRSVVVDELERLFAIPGVVAEEDFRPVVELLRDEGFYTERARRLLALAVQAARQSGPTPGQGIPEALGTSLLDLLAARFGLEPAKEMAVIAEASGPDVMRRLASSPRFELRAVAAAAFARSLERARQDPGASEALREERALLLGLLEDPEPVVEAAACRGLGSAGVEEARTDLLVRARGGAEGLVRAAALRGLASLGGENVLEALVLGTSAPDALVRRAAAEGLADLRDPRTAPVLVSLLGQGRESELFEPARTGLIALGEPAWTELARAANSPAHRSRREAAMVLSYQGVARSAGALIGFLLENPADTLVKEELAVLSCVDHRQTPDATAAWQRWWDEVVRDDSLAWLRAAMERRGVPAPSSEALRGKGNLQGALFLLEVVARPEDFLAERGRRELGRMLGVELGEAPRSSAEREAWLAGLRARVGERFDS